MIDNSDRIIETILSEIGKAWEDAQIAEVGARPPPSGTGPRTPRSTSPTSASDRVAFVEGRELIVRRVPVGVVGVIGPWNYPLTNSFGDCVPAHGAPATP